MATLVIESARDRARAAKVQAAVDTGKIYIVARRPGIPYPRPADGIFSKPPFNFTRELDIADQIEVFGFDPRYLLPTPKTEAVPELETDGYDATCGMKPVEQWYLDTLWEEFDDWRHCGCPEEPMPPAMVEALFSQSLLYSQTLLSIDRSVAVKPAPLPQFLQSREDVMEQIAMSKAPITPRKIDELVEAVQFSVEHWDSLDARNLPDGYRLHSSLNEAYVILTHPDVANRVVVGMKDPLSHDLEFVSSRGEIRSFILKVKQAGEVEEAAA